MNRPKGRFIENAILFSFQILGIRNLTRALQSSPFQNPGGGSKKVTDRGRSTEYKPKLLCPILNSLCEKVEKEVGFEKIGWKLRSHTFNKSSISPHQPGIKGYLELK